MRNSRRAGKPAGKKPEKQSLLGLFTKGKNIPTTAQQTLPYREMYRDGVCRVADRYYTKTIEYEDINYQLAQSEDCLLYTSAVYKRQTFANDNGQNPLMDKARAYVENWKEAYKNNTGLLLFGDVGTGKSFFAGCIANALLDRDVPVLMTNFPTILNRLTGMFSEDRADFITSFDEYDLLIIDDLGVERSTEYALSLIHISLLSNPPACISWQACPSAFQRPAGRFPAAMSSG